MKKLDLTRDEGILILVVTLLLGFVIGLWVDQSFENSLQRKLDILDMMIESTEVYHLKI